MTWHVGHVAGVARRNMNRARQCRRLNRTNAAFQQQRERTPAAAVAVHCKIRLFCGLAQQLHRSVAHLVGLKEAVHCCLEMHQSVEAENNWLMQVRSEEKFRIEAANCHRSPVTSDDAGFGCVVFMIAVNAYCLVFCLLHDKATSKTHPVPTPTLLLSFRLKC